MRSVVNIVNGERRFPFIVESIEEKGHMVQNQFALLDVDQVHSMIDENTIVISNEETASHTLYRDTNNWRYGDFGIQHLTDIEEPRPISQEEESLLEQHYGERIDEIVSRYFVLDGVPIPVLDMMLALREIGQTPQLVRYPKEIQILPSIVNRFYVRISFPDFSPSTYKRHARYTVDIVTRIGLTKVVLASKIFSTDDLLSLSAPFQKAGYGYHQYIDIDVFDPWDLMYSEDCTAIRENYCYEAEYSNNCGSMLDVEINLVDESSYDDSWIPSSEYSCGRNMITISDRDSDYMTLELGSEYDLRYGCTFKAKIVFNESFDGDIGDYFRETYFIDVDHYVAEIVVMDDENIYKMYESQPIYDMTSTEYVFNTEHVRFNSWNEYIEGMYVTCTFRLFDGYGNEIMDIRSNSIPMTKDIFSTIVGEKIDIYEEMDVTIHNVEVLNKIEKKIVSLARPDDYKSNIIKPVFYSAHKLENIELHQGVTFNIGIDLDQYKSKVDNFSIRIEGLSFPEIGRVPGYVIFRVNGETLPKTDLSGTYYILDGEGTLVTYGKYSYSG